MDSSTSERLLETENSGCPELHPPELHPELHLMWRGRAFRLAGGADACFTIGLQRENDLVIPGTHASRSHATLNWRRNRFELIDHSTNGTYVQLEDDQLSYVHRSTVFLWGAGFLSFGQPLTAENALKFGHA